MRVAALVKGAPDWLMSCCRRPMGYDMYPYLVSVLYMDNFLRWGLMN